MIVAPFAADSAWNASMPSTPAAASRPSFARRCRRSSAFLRFLQVELQPVKLTDCVKPFPRLAERETELPVEGDRAGKVVDQELWSEGCHPRLRFGGSQRASMFRPAPPPDDTGVKRRAGA